MTDGPEDWVVERLAGRAADLHRLPVPDQARRTVRVMEVDRPAIILGSSQGPGVVDSERVERAGVDIARRRSGGGAVLLRPGDHLWVDLLVPSGDPLWKDDVVVAAFWAGEAWADALGQIGLGPARVHRAGVDETVWSRLVCFSGLGPGEVTIGSRKVVGLSQRRSRSWVRIQTTAFTSFDPWGLVDLLDLTSEERARAGTDLATAAAGVSGDRAEVLDALLTALPRA